MTKILRGLVVTSALLLFASPAGAAPQTFAPGSLIIPMDIDTQDVGMLRAFGLEHQYAPALSTLKLYSSRAEP